MEEVKVINDVDKYINEMLGRISKAKQSNRKMVADFTVKFSDNNMLNLNGENSIFSIFCYQQKNVLEATSEIRYLDK